MELHENLYALGLRLGREVFEDPDSFRGALDDFLDEESATTGDINLLVDAVRLGGFSSMTSMLGSGAQVTAAVEEAGSRLARDRGSADVAGAQWACAVLGFAIGKVSDAEVRRYRTQHASPQPSSQPLPPTQFPQQPPPSPAPPTQYPGAPVTGGPPPGTGPLPTAQPMYAASSGPPPQSWPGSPGLRPEPKRKTWPLIVATVAAIALIAGGIVALIVTRDDGDPVRSGNGDRGSSESVDDDLPTDIESVSERYGPLAGDLASSVDECEAADASDGAKEALTCTFADGTLELTTYETAADLESGREANTGIDPATRLSRTDAGVVYGVDSASAVSVTDTTSIYWDSNDGLQSGLFVASNDELTIDDLADVFENTAPAVGWPTAPEDDGMVALAEEFVKLSDCNRIQTIQEGELEESICSAPKGITIFMGVFETNQDFKSYRRQAIQQGSDQGYPLRHWNFDGSTREGAAAEYINSSGSAVRYWDKDDCKCYMEASLSGDDAPVDLLQTVEDWWINA